MRGDRFEPPQSSNWWASVALDPAAEGADAKGIAAEGTADAKHAEAGVAAKRCADGADESWMSSDSQSSPVSAGISRTSSHRVRFDDSSHDVCVGVGAAYSDGANLHALSIAREVERGEDGATAVASVAVDAPVSEEAKRIAAEYAKLEIVSEWSGWLHFFDNDSEAEYHPAIPRSQAIVACAALVAVVVALFVLVAVEFRGMLSHVLAAQIIFILVSVIGVGLAVAQWNHATERITSMWKRLSILVCGGAMFVLTSLAAALSRPSVVGNDTLYMAIMICEIFSLVASGTPWRRASLYMLLFLGVNEVLFVSLGGKIKTYGILYIVACYLPAHSIAAVPRADRSAAAIATCDSSSLRMIWSNERRSDYRAHWLLLFHLRLWQS